MWVRIPPRAPSYNRFMDEKKPEPKLPLEEPKEAEEKTNPLLDIVENLDIEPDSVEIKISIPFD